MDLHIANGSPWQKGPRANSPQVKPGAAVVPAPGPPSPSSGRIRISGASSISVGHSGADANFLPRTEIAFKGQRPVASQPGPTAQVDVSHYNKVFYDTIRSRMPGHWPGIRERMVFLRTLLPTAHSVGVAHGWDVSHPWCSNPSHRIIMSEQTSIRPTGGSDRNGRRGSKTVTRDRPKANHSIEPAEIHEEPDIEANGIYPESSSRSWSSGIPGLRNPLGDAAPVFFMDGKAGWIVNPGIPELQLGNRSRRSFRTLEFDSVRTPELGLEDPGDCVMGVHCRDQAAFAAHVFLSKRNAWTSRKSPPETISRTIATHRP